MQSIVLKILSKCNWSCEYCDNTSDQIVPIEKVKYYIKELQTYNPDIEISFTGGEPGLLPIEYLKEIFNTLNNPCEIATNGTFLKKYYHYAFPNKIINFSYHITPSLDIKPKIFDTDGIPANYIVVVHKQNINDLSQFLKNYENVKIRLKPYIGVDKKLILDKADFEYLNTFNNIDEYTKESIKNFLQYSSNEIKELQEKCQNRICVPRIDLLQDKIYRCCAGNTNNVDVAPLNKFVLDMMFKRNVFPCQKGCVCNNCHHNIIFN